MGAGPSSQKDDTVQLQETSAPINFGFGFGLQPQAQSQPSSSASDDIPILSVFHPFPLRLDTPGAGTKIQYDACFQVGEFPPVTKSTKLQGTKIVILIPLKADPNPGDGAIFVNAVSRHIPSILAARPDLLNGYPDVPAATGADWNIAQIVKTDRSYYTWVNKDGTRVIVMAEPILVSQGDITNILRLPVTPPEDVIHEIGAVRYKPAPPIDSKGNPVPCKSRVSVPQMVPGPTAVAMTKVNKPAVSGTDWLAVILGILGSIAVFIGIWFGLKAAMGPGGDFLKTIGDALGKSLAGGYDALKKARSGTAGVLGIGPGGPLPARRTTQRKLPGDLTIKTPAQVATTAAPPGTPAAMGNISPVNLPEPSGDFTMTNPKYSSKQDFIDRHKTQRKVPGSKIRTPAQVAQTPASPGTPAATADIPAPDADEILRRQRAERNRVAQPAGTGLFDLGNRPGPIDDIAQRKPKGPPRARMADPSESNTPRIARLARAKKASRPEPKPNARKIIEEPKDGEESTEGEAEQAKEEAARVAKEETSEERIERRAKETALPRFMPNLKTQYMAKTGAVVRGGKKRKNRMKTGRKV